MTSQRTFRALHAAHAFAALRLTGLGLPLASNPAILGSRFFDPESWDEAGDCEALLPSCEVDLSALMMPVAGVSKKRFSPVNSPACDQQEVSIPPFMHALEAREAEDRVEIGIL
jgi:hypothetical protein